MTDLGIAGSAETAVAAEELAFAGAAGGAAVTLLEVAPAALLVAAAAVSVAVAVAVERLRGTAR